MVAVREYIVITVTGKDQLCLVCDCKGITELVALDAASDISWIYSSLPAWYIPDYAEGWVVTNLT
jgi:hypothetical protein